MHDYLLLTGATGLVGRYLVRDLLLNEEPLAVIIRSQKDLSAAARLEQILAHWEHDLGTTLPRPVCLEGDITQPNLGLSSEDRRWVGRHCRTVLHNAASLKFVGRDPNQEPWLSNYTGTRNVLDLCRQTRLTEFHYVSTAYVSGCQNGLILETDLDRGQTFRNDYERCKFEAEKLVAAADYIPSRTIYRPAIIVGDSRTGYTTTYHALYTYFQFIELACNRHKRDADGRVHVPLRLTSTGEEHRNLVPVDWVSAVTTRLVTSPQFHGTTYHLTPTSPVTARELVKALASKYRFHGVEFIGPNALPRHEMNPVERLFATYVAQYQPYWAQEPRFDCTRTLAAVPSLQCPLLDEACIHRLIDFATADNWGRPQTRRANVLPVPNLTPLAS